MASKLQQAIARLEKLEAEKRPLAELPPLVPANLDRADRHYPAGGLVLRVHTRDLPRDPPQEGRWANSWNQDYAWFKKEEARQWLPEKIAPGESIELPRPLAERLVRMHFLDNVRGQTTHFPASAVKEAVLTSRVESVEGDIVTLKFAGQTKAEQEGRWSLGGRRRGGGDRSETQKRGMELKLHGHAKFDRALGRFTTFELLAIGQRWGATRYNVRSRDLDPSPYGILVTLAGDTPAQRVAPEHFWAYEWR